MTVIRNKDRATRNRFRFQLTAWLQVFRVPNLFTVPGDPLAGFCLACAVLGREPVVSFYPLCLVLMTSLICYCAGLLQNDYFDLGEDLIKRPFRPLPGGKIKPATAIIVSSFLMVTGIILAFLVNVVSGMTVIIMVIVITVYNHSGKQLSIAGPVLMGMCRGLNFMMGAGITGWAGILTNTTFFSAVFLSIYIATVTHIAASETESYGSGNFRWIPLITLTVWFLFLYFILDPSPFIIFMVFLMFACLSCIWAFYCGNLLDENAPPPVVQQTIGRFLRGLLLVQATVTSASGYVGCMIALILLVAWPVSRKLSGYFYAS